MRGICISIIILMSVFFISLIGCTTIVRTPPPQPRVEIRPVPPYPYGVWIQGHWVSRHGQWVWVAGHWKRPPAPKAVWIPGHWKKVPRGWKWVRGQWKK